jgi:hypothetical protein
MFNHVEFVLRLSSESSLGTRVLFSIQSVCPRSRHFTKPCGVAACDLALLPGYKLNMITWLEKGGVMVRDSYIIM